MPGRDSKCKEKNPKFTMLVFKKRKGKKDAAEKSLI